MLKYLRLGNISRKYIRSNSSWCVSSMNELLDNNNHDTRKKLKKFLKIILNCLHQNIT